MIKIEPVDEEKIEHFKIGKARGTIKSGQGGIKVVEAEYLEGDNRLFISARFKKDDRKVDKIKEYLDPFMVLVLKAIGKY